MKSHRTALTFHPESKCGSVLAWTFPDSVILIVLCVLKLYSSCFRQVNLEVLPSGAKALFSFVFSNTILNSALGCKFHNISVWLSSSQRSAAAVSDGAGLRRGLSSVAR